MSGAVQAGTAPRPFIVADEYHKLLVREWEKAYQRPVSLPLPNDAEQAALAELEKVITARAALAFGLQAGGLAIERAKLVGALRDLVAHPSNRPTARALLRELREDK